MEAKCSLACEYLSEEDYMDLLWTTLSEFPGEGPAPGGAGAGYRWGCNLVPAGSKSHF